MKTAFMGLIACVLMVGCATEPAPAPLVLAEDPPALGNEGVQNFLAGRWVVTLPPMDSELAKRLGVESLQDAEEMREVYEFSPDGTFTYGYFDVDWRVEGKWNVGPQMIDLQYLTYNGKPLQQLGEEKRKEAEGGTQAGQLGDLMYDNLMSTLQTRPYLTLTEDRKGFLFTTGEPGAMGMVAGGGALSRLKATPKTGG